MNTVKIGILTLGFFLGNQVIAQETKEPTPPNSDKLFARMDKNADGSIDKAEFAAAKEKREEKTGKEINEEKQFAKFDTNGDGLISKEEFNARKEELKEKKEARDSKPAKNTTSK